MVDQLATGRMVLLVKIGKLVNMLRPALLKSERRVEFCIGELGLYTVEKLDSCRIANADFVW